MARAMSTEGLTIDGESNCNGFDREGGETGGSSESEGKNEKSIEEPLDEFDFLNVLGLTPVTAGPGNNKRWRLWNPEVDAHTWDDDILCHDIELQETHHDTPLEEEDSEEESQSESLLKNYRPRPVLPDRQAKKIKK